MSMAKEPEGASCTSRALSQVAVSCFFVQAEDGIRALTVTGVQTCALPILDEANIETHGMGAELQGWFDKAKHPAYLPEWAAAHMDREKRMVERDKNHASVIIWSMGNECGNGPVFHDAYKWIKDRDPSRPVQLEQAGEDWNTDIVSPMYPRIRDMRRYAEDTKKTRPYIMCEYSHAMGNSNGN